MARFALLISLLFTLSACASTSGSKKEAAPEAATEEAPAEEAAAEEAPAPERTGAIQFADIPFAAFDPEKPEGIHVYPISGNPKETAFSAMVRFPAGFRSPLHTHQASFSAVTMSEGLVHGTAADASEALPKGSTWYQPGGEPHVDACQSEKPCYMLVFFEGAVDMTPADAAAAEPTAQINPADQIAWAEVKGGVKMHVIHGNPQEGAFQALIHFPAGMTTNIHTHSSAFVGSILSGTHHRGPNADELQTLTEGAVWSEAAEAPHMEKCGEESDCIFAVAMNGALDTNAVELTPAAAE